MAAITAALVKDLREKTGAGMMDCKKALTETDGDLEGAVDWLRKKGLAAAAKKSGRVAAEGLVGVASAPGKAAVVEVTALTTTMSPTVTGRDSVDENVRLATPSAFAGTVEATAYVRSTVGAVVSMMSALAFPSDPEAPGPAKVSVASLPAASLIVPPFRASEVVAA